MSLIHFLVLNVVDTLLSLEGQRGLGFHQKYLNLCCKDEQRSNGFWMTWGCIINDRILIFGWTNPLTVATRSLSLWINWFIVKILLSVHIFYICLKVAMTRSSDRSFLTYCGTNYWKRKTIYGKDLVSLADWIEADLNASLKLIIIIINDWKCPAYVTREGKSYDILI